MRKFESVLIAVAVIIAGILSPGLAQEELGRQEPPTVKLESESGVLTVRCLDPEVRVMIEQGGPRSEVLTLEREEHVVRLNWGGYRIELGTELSPTELWLADCYASPGSENLNLESARSELARSEMVYQRLAARILELSIQEDSPKRNRVLSILKRENDVRRGEITRLRENLRELVMQNPPEQPVGGVGLFGSTEGIGLKFAESDLVEAEEVLLLLTMKRTELKGKLEANPTKTQQVLEVLDAEIDRRRSEVKTLHEKVQEKTARLHEEVELTATRGEDGLIRVVRMGRLVATVSLGDAVPTD